VICATVVEDIDSDAVWHADSFRRPRLCSLDLWRGGTFPVPSRSASLVRAIDALPGCNDLMEAGQRLPTELEIDWDETAGSMPEGSARLLEATRAR